MISILINIFSRKWERFPAALFVVIYVLGERVETCHYDINGLDYQVSGIWQIWYGTCIYVIIVDRSYVFSPKTRRKKINLTLPNDIRIEVKL